MKIDIAKEDLQILRDLVWGGRSLQNRHFNEIAVVVGTKMLKKLNQALKKVYGHDCNGENYL